VQDSTYHVLLDGAQVGPYDRRTIVGMRIRKALGSRDVVVAADGRRLTVRDLVRRPEADSALPASRTASRSVVQAIHAASLVEVDGAGCCEVPPFRGELQLRVQTRALRIEGRWRQGRAWKQDRLKIPLEQVVHAGLRGSLVDLGLRTEAGAALQRLTLDLRTPQAAGEFAASLTGATAWPFDPVPRSRPGIQRLAWAGVAGVAVLVTGVLVGVWVLTHR
jgi:hypothetical protein